MANKVFYPQSHLYELFENGDGAGDSIKLTLEELRALFESLAEHFGYELVEEGEE